MAGRSSLRSQLEWSRSFAGATASYLAAHRVRKLHLGAGTNVLDGWLNTDLAPAAPEVFFLDTTRRFPLEDATFDYVMSEHHIEHLAYADGLFTLRECHRVLRPGGRLRVATPDLAVLLGLYADASGELQRRYLRFITDTFLPEAPAYDPVFVINNAFSNWGHRFLYDRATLKGAMERAGFVAISAATPGDSQDEHLRGVDGHGEFIDDEELNRFETMVLEGERPAGG
jgi:predicted SAM-dependent methyltransferase